MADLTSTLLSGNLLKLRERNNYTRKILLEMCDIAHFLHVQKHHINSSQMAMRRKNLIESFRFVHNLSAEEAQEANSIIASMLNELEAAEECSCADLCCESEEEFYSEAEVFQATVEQDYGGWATLEEALLR